MLTTADLNQFTGTDAYHRHMFGLLLTDGAKYFADQVGGYWFMDIVATEFRRLDEFVTITMRVADSKAVITVDDGNGHVLKTKKINYTDCPPGEWKFFFQEPVMMVVSEY